MKYYIYGSIYAACRIHSVLKWGHFPKNFSWKFQKCSRTYIWPSVTSSDLFTNSLEHFKKNEHDITYGCIKKTDHYKSDWKRNYYIVQSCDVRTEVTFDHARNDADPIPNKFSLKKLSGFFVQKWRQLNSQIRSLEFLLDFLSRNDASSIPRIWIFCPEFTDRG